MESVLNARLLSGGSVCGNTDGWVDGGVGEWMSGQVGRELGRWMDGQMDR